MKTSWQPEAKWYNKIVADKGHYYHQHVIIPNTLKLLELNQDSRVLDLGCGQGVLAKSLPNNVYYQGIDLAPSLIDFAKKQDRNPNHRFLIGDITKPLININNDFTHATLILSLQNVENIRGVLENVKNHLVKNGKLLIVINHPCFRIPRQSSWGIDEKNKTEYRRINMYMTSLKIPINMHPGQDKSALTWSFHNSISTYSKLLKANGFIIDLIDEWVSDKKSEGRAGKMENRARNEFPLFMVLSSRLHSS